MLSKIAITPAGSSGAAVGSAALFPFGPQSGVLNGIYIAYSASITSATTTVRLTLRDPAVTLLSLVSATAPGWFFPRVAACSVTGASITAYVGFPFDVPMIVNVSSSTPVTDAVTVYAYA